MKAIQYRTYGGYQENRLVDLERTRLKEGEVLVEMRTVGINPLDNTFRSGHIYLATPENLPRVGGQTGVGVVVGSGNTAFKVGDRVFVSSPALGLAADGTWREFVSAPASALSRVPAEIDDARLRRENVRLEERTRIAQELHDTLLQTFLSASMQLDIALDVLPAESSAKPLLNRILEIMRRGIEEGRSSIKGLRSSESGATDLVKALTGVQQELPVRHDIDFCVRVAGRQQPLSPLVEQETYRIGREALLNALSHSGAARVECELEYADHGLQIRIRDDGMGIDPQVLNNGREGHWGLACMRERAARLGGSLTISSSATAGTEVRFSVPSSIAFQISMMEKSA